MTKSGELFCNDANRCILSTVLLNSVKPLSVCLCWERILSLVTSFTRKQNLHNYKLQYCKRSTTIQHTGIRSSQTITGLKQWPHPNWSKQTTVKFGAAVKPPSSAPRKSYSSQYKAMSPTFCLRAPSSISFWTCYCTRHLLLKSLKVIS